MLTHENVEFLGSEMVQNLLFVNSAFTSTTKHDHYKT